MSKVIPTLSVNTDVWAQGDTSSRVLREVTLELRTEGCLLCSFAQSCPTL